MVQKTLMGVSLPAICAGLSVVLASLTAPSEAAACRGVIGDFVWVDSNQNGIQDAGEPGINGVTLLLTNNQGQDPRSTVTANHPVTAAPGWYEFDRITCEFDFTVTVDASTVPAGYTATTIGAGTDTNIDSNDPAGTTVNFPWTDFNPVDLSLDFGYIRPCTGSIGDVVWLDLDRDGQQDPGEPRVSGAIVSLDSNAPVFTDMNGNYLFTGLCAGTYKVSVQIPAGYEPTLNDVGNDETDSDGTSDGAGSSVVMVTLATDFTNDLTSDFGFAQPLVQVGAGTPGYWKNHPEAWPVVSIDIGGVIYGQDEALEIMGQPDGDKTITMFRSLVSTKLNLAIGTDSSCIASTVASADAWMTTYGPLGSRVKASSYAWRVGEPLYRTLDNYNNGMLCAPSRD